MIDFLFFFNQLIKKNHTGPDLMKNIKLPEFGFTSATDDSNKKQ